MPREYNTANDVQILERLKREWALRSLFPVREVENHPRLIEVMEKHLNNT